MSNPKYHAITRTHGKSAHDGLYFEDLTLLTKNNTPFERERDEIYVEKVNMSFYQANADNADYVPVICRWALLQMKQDNTSEVTAIDTLELNRNLFLRENTNEGTNFDETITCLQRSMIPFNPHRWDVIAEGQHMLAPKRGNSAFGLGLTETQSGDQASFIWYDEEIPVNRSCHYDSNDPTSCSDSIVFVWFTGRINTLGITSAIPSAVQNCFTHYRMVMKFTDVIS